MLLQLAFLGSLKEGEDTCREGKNHHYILMFVTIKILLYEIAGFDSAYGVLAAQLCFSSAVLCQ